MKSARERTRLVPRDFRALFGRPVLDDPLVTPDFITGNPRPEQAPPLQINQTEHSRLHGDSVAGAAGSSRVRLRRTATQSIADNTNTTVSFDTTDVDTNNYYASATAIQFPFTGQYVLGAAARFAANANNRRVCWIQKSTDAGSTWADIPTLFAVDAAPSGTEVCVPQTSTMSSFNVGDQARVRVFQNRGGGTALNLQDAVLWVFYLGPFSDTSAP